MQRTNQCHCERPKGAWQSFKKDCFVASLLAMTLLPSMVFASVAGEVNKANDLYKQGKFDDSVYLYQKALEKDDRSGVIKYDLGTALYKKGEYSKALGYLEQASEGKNDKIRPSAEYNLGNVLYRSGIQKENTNVDDAIKSLQEALGHYGQTLAVDPKDRDAIYNQDFVKKEIERLKQKKQQQQQQNQQQNQKQNNNDQQNKQGKQNQQNQQNQQGQQEQQNNTKDQKEQRSNSEAQAQKQQNAQAQVQQDQKELDRQQAEDMLENYKENEEPKKLLNYMPKKINDRPVLKDW